MPVLTPGEHEPPQRFVSREKGQSATACREKGLLAWRGFCWGEDRECRKKIGGGGGEGQKKRGGGGEREREREREREPFAMSKPKPKPETQRDRARQSASQLPRATMNPACRTRHRREVWQDLSQDSPLAVPPPILAASRAAVAARCSSSGRLPGYRRRSIVNTRLGPTRAAPLLQPHALRPAVAKHQEEHP